MQCGVCKDNKKFSKNFNNNVYFYFIFCSLILCITRKKLCISLHKARLQEAHKGNLSKLVQSQHRYMFMLVLQNNVQNYNRA